MCQAFNFAAVHHGYEVKYGKVCPVLLKIWSTVSFLQVGELVLCIGMHGATSVARVCDGALLFVRHGIHVLPCIWCKMPVHQRAKSDELGGG
jgi:hypothetical protein